MRRLMLVATLILTASAGVPAQVVVTDPAVTLRNAATAAAKEVLLRTQQDQHSQLRRMAQRLSLFTDLAKFRIPDPPRWRIHDFEDVEAFLFSRDYHAALNYGDSTGSAYAAVTHPVIAARAYAGRLGPSASRLLLARLATIEGTDASVIAATNDSGRLRYNGRRELAAIDALEGHVVDPSQEQSATAVLDKISGAGLIAARQRQTRTQFLVGVLEQLLMENKRARDAEAGVMNMQIVAWRDGRVANQAFGAGTGDALRTWRQP